MTGAVVGGGDGGCVPLGGNRIGPELHTVQHLLDVSS